MSAPTPPELNKAPSQAQIQPGQVEGTPDKKKAAEVIETGNVDGKSMKITKVPNEAGQHSGRMDETRKGGEVVARINTGQYFQVQDAEGRPIPGRVFDPEQKKIVDA